MDWYKVSLVVFFISIAAYLFGVFPEVALVIAGISALVCAALLIVTAQRPYQP